MNVLQIPYNALIGLQASNESPEYLLELPDSPQMHNHLNTVHASAQFALAEATSGQLLVQSFPDLASHVLPVVRRVEVKYSRPAQGRLRSKASISEEMLAKVRADLPRKKRLLVPVSVEIVDTNGRITMSAIFEWFVQYVTTVSVSEWHDGL